MEIGDVIVVKGNGFISKIIQKVTGSPWTHTALYIGDERIIETNWNKRAGIMSNPYFEGSKFDYVVLSMKKRMSKETRDLIIKGSNHFDKTGNKYDFLLIISLLFNSIFKKLHLPILNRKNKFICTELVDEIFKSADIKLFPKTKIDIYPEDYIMLDEFHIIESHSTEIDLIELGLE